MLTAREELGLDEPQADEGCFSKQADRFGAEFETEPSRPGPLAADRP